MNRLLVGATCMLGFSLVMLLPGCCPYAGFEIFCPRVGLDFWVEYEVTERPDTTHVVMMPGIMGPKGLGPQVDFFGRRGDLTELDGVSADLWNWPQHPSVKGKTMCQALSAWNLGGAAADLRSRIQRIRAANPESKISILAASGGCLVVALACEEPNALSDLDSVVFVSASFRATFDLEPVKKAAKKVYNYASSSDGYLGSADAGYAGTNSPGIHQLLYQSLHREDVLDNNGGHVRALEDDFFQAYFVPIFGEKSDQDSKNTRHYMESWRLTE